MDIDEIKHLELCIATRPLLLAPYTSVVELVATCRVTILPYRTVRLVLEHPTHPDHSQVLTTRRVVCDTLVNSARGDY